MLTQQMDPSGWGKCGRQGITVTSCKRNEVNRRTAVIRKAVSTAVVIRLRAYLCITSLIISYSVLFLCVISMASWKGYENAYIFNGTFLICYQLQIWSRCVTLTF